MCVVLSKGTNTDSLEEARAALVKPAQRNKFRYAALIQQEKNKMLKLKYALEIKRKQQQVDLIKRQAHIRASIFRDEIAIHELRHITMAADKNVSLEMNKTEPKVEKNEEDNNKNNNQNDPNHPLHPNNNPNHPLNPLNLIPPNNR